MRCSPYHGAVLWSVRRLFRCGIRHTLKQFHTEELTQMSALNGDKARFHRQRKKKLLRRQLHQKLSSSQKAGSFPGGASEKNEAARRQKAIPGES